MEKKLGGRAFGGDAVAVVGYRKVVKREFPRESPLPLRLSLGVGGSRLDPSNQPRSQDQNTSDIFPQGGRFLRRTHFNLSVVRKLTYKFVIWKAEKSMLIKFAFLLLIGNTYH